MQLDSIFCIVPLESGSQFGPNQTIACCLVCQIGRASATVAVLLLFVFLRFLLVSARFDIPITNLFLPEKHEASIASVKTSHKKCSGSHCDTKNDYKNSPPWFLLTPLLPPSPCKLANNNSLDTIMNATSFDTATHSEQATIYSGHN